MQKLSIGNRNNETDALQINLAEEFYDLLINRRLKIQWSRIDQSHVYFLLSRHDLRWNHSTKAMIPLSDGEFSLANKQKHVMANDSTN